MTALNWNMFESDIEREYEREEYYLELEQDMRERQLLREAFEEAY